MNLFQKLLSLAEAEVARVMALLPQDIREAAQECLITYEEVAEEEYPELEDLLGLFEGLNRLDPEPASPDEMPRVRLFLDNLWDYAGANEREFCREVRITYLHELGHYLGWGEEEVEALGLG